MAEFSDHKDEGALRTIGEVASATGIKTHVLRYWEQQFPQLKPLKRSGGRRYYRADDVALVERIDRLVNRDGYTLKGAKAALRDGSEARSTAKLVEPQQQVASTQSAAADALPRLKVIRDQLQAALTA